MGIKKVLSKIMAAVFIMGLSSNHLYAAGEGDIVTADHNKHFDPKGKMPSEYTLKLREMRRIEGGSTGHRLA